MNWPRSPPAARQKVKPDDHSEVVPLLPIPNRTVKRLCADDSAGSRVKVGHRQAIKARKSPPRNRWAFVFLRFVFRGGCEHALAVRAPCIALRQACALRGEL